VLGEELHEFGIDHFYRLMLDCGEVFGRMPLRACGHRVDFLDRRPGCTLIAASANIGGSLQHGRSRECPLNSCGFKAHVFPGSAADTSEL